MIDPRTDAPAIGDGMARLATGAGVVLLAVSVSSPWWRTIHGPEPTEAFLGRILALVVGMIAVHGLISKGHRALCRVLSTAGALLLPLLVLVAVSLDAPAISTATQQEGQARRLIRYIAYADNCPQVAWNDGRLLYAVPAVRNDYNFVDAVEVAASFARVAWYVALTAGVLLLIATWGCPGAHAVTVRLWRPAVAALGICVAGFGLRPAAGSYYTYRAKVATVRMEYRKALVYYRKALQWDPRLDYDVAVHYEMGRLYGYLGDTHQPDYWAAVADLYGASGAVDAAFATWETRVRALDQNPALPIRYASALLSQGARDYANGRYTSAIARWNRAARMDPENVEVLYALATGYSTTADYHAAIDCCTHLIEASDSVGLSRFKYTASYTYRKVITARAWKLMGWCYYRLGDWDRARVCDQQSTQLNSRDPHLS